LESNVTLVLTKTLAGELRIHGEAAYPHEGAGLILGRSEGERRVAQRIVPIANRWPENGRRRRYRLDPQDLMRAEDEADREGLDIVGVFHSHPDHPAAPSDTDREWALPWYVYVITSVRSGRAAESTGWRLAEDRTRFDPVPIQTVS
jgi:proteasome lid subunit RPN8/RPN11